MADEQERLEALGRAQPPPPEPSFVDGLALRARAPRPSHRLPVLLPAAAVIAVVVGIGVLLLARGGGDGGTIVVQTAVDASVRPGQELAEGAEITTGAAGSVTVAGETLGPGERAVVRQGRLRRRQIPVTLELQALPVGRRGVALRWTRYDGADFGRYVVLRGLRVRGERLQQDDTALLVRVPPVRAVRYVVVVLDRADRAVARSAPVVVG